MRCFADEQPGFPCRVTLEDASPGEELLLLSFEHHAVSSPYRAAGPIYLRCEARRPFDATGVCPPVAAHRLLSVRGYDVSGMLRGAELVEGSALAVHLERAFEDRVVAYIHVHIARPGCFLFAVTRA